MTTTVADSTNQAMARVYRNTGVSVFTTAVVAYTIGHEPALIEFFLTGPMFWVVMLAPLAMVVIYSLIFPTLQSPFIAYFILQLFSTVMGISLSTIFLQIDISIITSAFIGATVLFTIMAVYGMTTSKDLTSWGSFLIVGLLSLIVVSIINMFVASTPLDFILSGIGVIVFLGFSAYDAQKIQEMVAYESTAAVEVMGAMMLYLDFINLFLNLLKLIVALTTDN